MSPSYFHVDKSHLKRLDALHMTIMTKFGNTMPFDCILVLSCLSRHPRCSPKMTLWLKSSSICLFVQLKYDMRVCFTGICSELISHAPTDTCTCTLAEGRRGLEPTITMRTLFRTDRLWCSLSCFESMSTLDLLVSRGSSSRGSSSREVWPSKLTYSARAPSTVGVDRKSSRLRVWAKEKSNQALSHHVHTIGYSPL